MQIDSHHVTGRHQHLDADEPPSLDPHQAQQGAGAVAELTPTTSHSLSQPALMPGVEAASLPLQPLPGNQPLVDALQRHAEAVFGEPVPTSGTPLYTDVRLYAAHGVPAVIYGAGPRTVLESNAKRADEHLVLSDLRGATKVLARTLVDLLDEGTPQLPGANRR